VNEGEQEGKGATMVPAQTGEITAGIANKNLQHTGTLGFLVCAPTAFTMLLHNQY
jgi:hypothetical protein